MKKILALLLALTIVFALTACSSGGSESGGGSEASQGENSEPEKSKVADDSSVEGMSFTPPEGFTEVKRSLDKTADGKLTEKTMLYTYDENTSISFVSNSKDSLEELLEAGGDKFKDVESNGKTFHVYEESSDIYALIGEDDKIFGLDYQHASDDTDRARYDEALASVKFEDTDTVTDNGDEEVIGDITYTLDSSLNIVSRLSTLTETTAGEQVKKDITWRFGKDADNIDFRFLLRIVNNAKVEDELNKDTTYQDASLMEQPCKVRIDGDGKTIEYYIQKGDDVYEIKNLGVYNGWSTSRSDESKTAFEAFIKTIAFK